MKYLKRFNESNGLIDNINDIILELKDDGFDVTISKDFYRKNSDTIDIRIKRNLTDSEFEKEFNLPDFKAINIGVFSISKIKETILTICSYLGDNSYEVDSVFVFGGDFNKGGSQGGELISLEEFLELSDGTMVKSVMIEFKKEIIK